MRFFWKDNCVSVPEVAIGLTVFVHIWLIALDGTEYFSSQKINCANCSQRQLANGKNHCYHSALTLVIVQANNDQVISLEPEFILAIGVDFSKFAVPMPFLMLPQRYLCR